MATRTVGRNLYVLSRSHLAHYLLWHVEVGIDGIQCLQRDDCSACGHVLPQVDLPDTQDSRKRRPNRLPLNRRFDFSNVCFGLPLLRCRFVIVHPGDNASIHQLPHPVVIDLCEITLRLHGGQLGSFLPGVKLYEHVSLMNELAGIKGDCVDGPRQVGAHGDTMYGRRRSHHAKC